MCQSLRVISIQYEAMNNVEPRAIDVNKIRIEVDWRLIVLSLGICANRCLTNRPLCIRVGRKYDKNLWIQVGAMLKR